MPYIKMADRKKFDQVFDVCPRLETKGELEYIIFRFMKHYMEAHPFRYTHLHDCCYAAAHCADEFRRRFLDAHETHVRGVNGDVDAE